ncbi:MAG: phosphoribosyl-ATP diphosphatase [Granulosicoccus sp.]
MNKQRDQVSTDNVLQSLSDAIAARKGEDPSASYTASLFELGEDAILQKVGEEAIEFLLAAKSGNRQQIVAEGADVWFHMLVYLSSKGLGPDDILSELQRREGVSGHAEKAARDSD